MRLNPIQYDHPRDHLLRVMPNAPFWIGAVVFLLAALLLIVGVKVRAQTQQQIALS